MFGQLVDVFPLAQRRDQVTLGPDPPVPVNDIRLARKTGKTAGRVGAAQRFRGADHGLGRHAADMDAGAADGAVADQADIGTLFGCRDGGGEAGRAWRNGLRPRAE